MSLSLSSSLECSESLQRGGATESPFQYDPQGRRQIRVLQLSPGVGSTQLSGMLHVRNLDDDELDYDALSYMWGDPTPVSTIIIRSQTLPIAHNLNEALHSLRHPAKAIILWFDAVYINQLDPNERAEQIALMRQLYSRALCVRSFLNNETPDVMYDALVALKRFNPVDDPNQSFGLRILVTCVDTARSVVC